MAETPETPNEVAALETLTGGRTELPLDATEADRNAQLLIDCIKAAVAIDPALFFEGEINVNWADPKTGLTLLHLAAGYADRELFRLLLANADTDYTVQDGRGRFASTMAYVHGRDVAMGRLLVKKQGDQAREAGLILYGPGAGHIRLDDDGGGA